AGFRESAQLRFEVVRPKIESKQGLSCREMLETDSFREVRRGNGNASKQGGVRVLRKTSVLDERGDEGARARLRRRGRRFCDRRLQWRRLLTRHRFFRLQLFRLRKNERDRARKGSGSIFG